MGGVTLNDLGEAAKLITTLMAGISAIGGMIVFIMKAYLKPIRTDLDSIKNNLSVQNNEITDIKNNVSIITSKYNELDAKSASNRKLDSLLVKTMWLLLDTNDAEQRKLKNEIDSFLVNEAVN